MANVPFLTLIKRIAEKQLYLQSLDIDDDVEINNNKDTENLNELKDTFNSLFDSN